MLDAFDIFFLYLMIFFILLLMCAIVGKIIAKQNGMEQENGNLNLRVVESELSAA
jgi:hypothetical protein